MNDTPSTQNYNISEFERFTMYTPTPGQENKRSKLVWSLFNGNPRITVFTGVPNDPNKGIINAPMEHRVINDFLTNVETVARSEPNTKLGIECYTSIWENNQLMEGKRLLCTAWTGKNREGLVWICLRAEGRPELVFTYTINEYHRYIGKDGNPLSESEASCRFAIGSSRLLREAYSRTINAISLTERMARDEARKNMRNRPSNIEGSPANKPKTKITEFEDFGF